MNNNPFAVFANWYQEAQHLDRYNAISLATVDSDGKPSVRTVFLKEYDENGFTFYTNLASKKCCDLANNPNIAILFFWRELGKQIMVRGKAQRVSDHQADKYFASRPRGSQIGAWASIQSQKMASHKSLENRYKQMQQKFADIDNVPRPDFWSGFTIKPNLFEFWQERKYRLHDRYQYELINGGWEASILYP